MYDIEDNPIVTHSLNIVRYLYNSYQNDALG